MKFLITFLFTILISLSCSFGDGTIGDPARGIGIVENSDGTSTNVSTWETVYNDNFARTNGDLGSLWTSSGSGGGTASIDGQRVIPNYVSGPVSMNYIQILSSNKVRVSLDFSPKGPGNYTNDGGLFVKRSGDNSIISACWWDNSPMSAHLVGDDKVGSSNITLLNGEYYTLILEMIDDNLTCTIKQGSTIVYSSSNTQSNTYIGSVKFSIMAGDADPNNTYLDNFKVEKKIE